jgi:hypothetical protein
MLHVNTPPVRGERRSKPAPEDCVWPGVDLLAQCQRTVVQLRQAAHAQPGLVFWGAVECKEPCAERLDSAAWNQVHKAAVVGNDIKYGYAAQRIAG